MTERTILILGDSPFLAKVHEKVRPLLDRYYSIGINNIITKYYTNEHIFVDKPFTALTNNYVGKTVSPKAYDALIHKENKYLVDMFSFSFEKHKIFLYQEDFSKFIGALSQAIGYIHENQPATEYAPATEENIAESPLDSDDASIPLDGKIDIQIDF